VARPRAILNAWVGEYVLFYFSLGLWSNFFLALLYCVSLPGGFEFSSGGICRLGMCSGSDFFAGWCTFSEESWTRSFVLPRGVRSVRTAIDPPARVPAGLGGGCIVAFSAPKPGTPVALEFCGVNRTFALKSVSCPIS